MLSVSQTKDGTRTMSEQWAQVSDEEIVFLDDDEPSSSANRAPARALTRAGIRRYTHPTEALKVAALESADYLATKAGRAF